MYINSERVQRIMSERGLDALVATTLGNVFYLTGVSSDGLRLWPYEQQSYAVVTHDCPTEPYFIATAGLVNQVWNGYRTIKDVVTYGKFIRFGPVDPVDLTRDEEWLRKVAQEYQCEANALDALILVLRKMDLEGATVGIDEFNIHNQYLGLLKERMPTTKFVFASKTFREIRKVKTPAEIEQLKVVSKIAEDAILAALEIAREGVTEYELARQFNCTVASRGGRPQFTCIRIGRNGVAGDVRPDQTPLKRGDIIWFDVGLEHNGFWADIARNACLGEPPTRARNIYQAMLVGEQAAIDQTVAGMTGEQLFDLTLDVCRKAGVPYYDRNHVGHGIGMEVYEDVLLAKGVKDVIEEGTVVNIETPYYEFGLGALHVEDPYVVRAGGNELLTTLSREFFVLD